MRKRFPGLVALVVVLAVILVAATASYAASNGAVKTVAVVTSGQTDRPVSLDEFEPALVKLLSTNGIAVVSGQKVAAAVAEMGITLNGGQPKTKTSPGTLPTVMDLDFLQQLGAKLGVTDIIGAHVHSWTRMHPFCRDAKSVISTVCLEVATGKVIWAIEDAAYKGRMQSDAALATRGLAAVAGTLFATGSIEIVSGRLVGTVFEGAPHHAWGIQRTLGLAVAIAAIIPWESRADVEIPIIQRNTKQTFKPLLPDLKAALA
jgi:hypothetical protein